MSTQITLPGKKPALSIELVREGEGEDALLTFSLYSSDSSSPRRLICQLNRIEAFTLWNFLDEALEIPLNSRR